MMAVLNLRMPKYEKNITNEFSGHYHPKATVKFFKKKYLGLVFWLENLR